MIKGTIKTLRLIACAVVLFSGNQAAATEAIYFGWSEGDAAIYAEINGNRAILIGRCRGHADFETVKDPLNFNSSWTSSFYSHGLVLRKDLLVIYGISGRFNSQPCGATLNNQNVRILPSRNRAEAILNSSISITQSAFYSSFLDAALERSNADNFKVVKQEQSLTNAAELKRQQLVTSTGEAFYFGWSEGDAAIYGEINESQAFLITSCDGKTEANLKKNFDHSTSWNFSQLSFIGFQLSIGALRVISNFPKPLWGSSCGAAFRAESFVILPFHAQSEAILKSKIPVSIISEYTSIKHSVIAQNESEINNESQQKKLEKMNGPNDHQEKLGDSEKARRQQEALARAEEARRQQEALARAEEARRQQEALARAEEARRQQEALARAEEARRQQEALARAEEARRQQEALARAEEARRQPRKNHQENTTLSVRKALVLGNDSYQNVPVLRNARSDASSIEQALSGLGYAVTAHYDVNEREMKKAVRDFIRTISGGDEVVFFYAGHGVQIGSANYLLPVDIRAEDVATVRDEAIPLQKVLDDFSEAKARFTLAIVDACRDNPFLKLGRTVGGRGLAPTSAASGQMIMFSAGSGQQALDRVGPNDRSPNGLFTRTLLKNIRNQSTSVDRILRQVRTEVVGIAKSVGHEQVPALYDQTIGDFYFLK